MNKNLKNKIKNIIKNKLSSEILKDFSIDKTLNIISDKYSKKVGIKNVEDFNDNKRKILYLKGTTATIGTIINVLKGQIPKGLDTDCEIYDDKNNLVYYTGSNTFYNEVMTVYDCNKNIVGKIKEHFYSKYSILIENETISKIKVYDRDEGYSFSMLEGNITITNNKKNEFRIKKSRKNIAIISKMPLKFSNEKFVKYVIELFCDDKEDEVLSILVACFIEIMK